MEKGKTKMKLDTNVLTHGCITCRLAEPTYSFRGGVMNVFCGKKNKIVEEKQECYYYDLSSFKSTPKEKIQTISI